MTKQDLIKLAGSQTELAKILGISKPAVSMWKAVPELRMRQLKDFRPEWFTKENTWKKHFLQFGLPPLPPWSGHLVRPTLITQMVNMWLAQPVAMEIIATQTAIELWFAKRLAALIVVGLHMLSAGTTPVRQHPQGWDSRCSPFFWAKKWESKTGTSFSISRIGNRLGSSCIGICLMTLIGMN